MQKYQNKIVPTSSLYNDAPLLHLLHEEKYHIYNPGSVIGLIG